MALPPVERPFSILVYGFLQCLGVIGFIRYVVMPAFAAFSCHPCRYRNNRNVRCFWILFKYRSCLDSVDIRQVHVHENQVWPYSFRVSDGFFVVASFNSLISKLCYAQPVFGYTFAALLRKYSPISRSRRRLFRHRPILAITIRMSKKPVMTDRIMSK